MTQAVPGPGPAGEGFASTAEALAAAASAFKAELGQAEAPERGRDARGRFGSGAGGGDEEIPDEDRGQIETSEEVPEPGAEADAESRDAAQEGSEEADADEAGAPPSDLGLPRSWNPEKAELWQSLDPDAQAYIRQRDAEQESAVNAKFMEAASLRKAHEAEIETANLDRKLYAEAVDQVLSLVVPQPPPRSMLDPQSGDYDPDAWHYRKAVHEETVAFLNGHRLQRQQLAAQEDAQAFGAINGATRDAFVAAVPDAADPSKAPAVLRELIDYAVSIGAPETVFATPTTALEWHVLWKAREYDRLQSAKARVRESPKPEPRKAAPAVRPGVTTPRSAIEQGRRHQALDRLRKEGSVDAGAAAIKQLMKGRIG
jgi:hypothetical protein